MAIQQVRSIATVPFTGILSVELMSKYTQAIRLRETLTTTATDGTKTTADSGFYSFRPFDPSALPPGGGYLAHIFDRPGGTLLATGVPVQRGARAAIELTATASPANTSTVTIAYPDMRDETATFALITEVYTFETTAPLGAGNFVLSGVSIAADLDALVTAINGSGGYGSSDVGLGAASCRELTARRTSATKISIEARQGGTWGNRITVTLGGVTNMTQTGTTAGTGNHGINVVFEDSALPNTLLESPSAQRHCHLEVFGVDDNNDAHKLIQGPCLLYGSSTVAPA